MSYVFISHSHKDKEFARKLSAALRHAGHVVWMDEAEILVGDSLIEKIRDGLDLPAHELERLRIDLQAANALVESFAKDLKRQRAVIASHQSPRLRAAIDEANKKFPDHRTVNEAYAFEVGGMPVTLDYLLWAITKERRRGHPHQLALLVQIEGKWDGVRLMLEAYQDYLGLTSDRKTGDAGPTRK